MDTLSHKPTIFVFTTAYYPFIGGAEVAIQETIKRLSSLYRFFIITARLRRDLPAIEHREHETIVRIGFGSSFDKFLIPFLGTWLTAKLLKKYRPVLCWSVMVTFASGIPYILNFFLQRKVPIVMTLQEGDSEAHLKRSRLGLIGLSWRLALPRSHGVTAISHYLSDLAHQFGYKGNVSLIPNGVDSKRFAVLFSHEERNAWRKKIGVPEDAFVVISTSRLSVKNALDTLISSLPYLPAEVFKKIILLLVGAGEEETALKNLVEKLGVQEKVIFSGAVSHSEIPYYLHGADVFVRPSRSEGMGISFVEAIAADLPIVGTPVGGIVDFLHDQRTGLMVPPENPKALANVITRLFRDAPLSATLRENAKRILGAYSWDGIAASYSDVFKTLSLSPRVLVTTGLFPPEIGGPATYSKLLLDELPRFGVDVRVLPFSSVRKFPKIIRHAIYFLKTVRRGISADIIFAQDPASVGLPAALAAWLLQKRFMLKVVGDYAWEQGMQRYGVRDLLDDFVKKSYGFQVWMMKSVERFVANQAEAIIVPSEYLKKIVTSWGVTSNMMVIPNAFDAPSLPPREAGEKVRSDRILLSVGRLVPWKGFEMLITLMPEWKKEFPDIKLVIIGSGPDMGHLQKKVEELKLEDSVLLKGAVPHDELLLHMRSSSLFVLNTGYEGLPHVVLEAMAMGLPVVTTDLGGNPEVIESYVDGILLPYNDRVSFKKAIADLLKDADACARMRSNAKEKIKQFSKENMLQTTARLIKSL